MPVFVNCRDTIETITRAIADKKGVIYLRYGDGDFNISMGQNDMLAVAIKPFIDLMNRSLSIRDERVMISIPHHSTYFNTLEEGMKPGNHEYPGHFVTAFLDKLQKFGELKCPIYTNIALSYLASHEPDVVINLHKRIKEHPVLFIGNYTIPTELLELLFGTKTQRINVPDRDAFFEHDRVFREFDDKYKQHYASVDYFIIIMAAGCAGRAFSAELYDKYFKANPHFLILDYGSLLDYLNGHSSRAYMNIDVPKKEYILSQLR